MRTPVRIAFSPDKFDHWRLSKVGGRITDYRGKPVFVFDSERQWKKYWELNQERK